MQVKGMLTRSELEQEVAAGRIDTILVVFTGLYGNLIGKRFDADFFLEEAAAHGTHGCDYLLTVDMEMEPIPGYAFANWDRGYGDFHLVPDLSTLRRLSWQDRTAMVLCDVYQEATHALVAEAPRSMLRKQVEAAAELGFDAFGASELEYYLYENSYRGAFESQYRDLKPSGWYLEDYHAFQGTRNESFHGAARRHLRDSGVPVETSKGEWGLGQHELNIRYADVLTMADRHMVYKQCLREVADQQGRSVTFMAKPHTDQAGSSCHIHLSLWKDGQSAFPGERQEGSIRCSDTFRWFLGGWIKYLPELMVLYAPTINAYKRYVYQSWAPTKLAWCHDNRTAGFRVVGSGNSLRIECRLAGADCNPYLAYTASLAAGLEGIRNQVEPPPLFSGDVYSAQDLPGVPASLHHATALFEQSAFAKRTLGEAVHQHYLHFFKTEIAAFDAAVTDWELKRYFERI